MSFEIKICGITTPEALEAAATAGADAIGFVFAESPRQIGIERARDLARLAPPTLTRIAVFKHPAPDVVQLVLETVDIDIVQSDVQDYDIIAPFLDGTPFRPVYRTLASPDGDPAPTGPSLLDTLSAHQHLNSGPVLVEGPRSGSGITPDWTAIAALPRTLRIILAGGLTPDNIAEAIRLINPAGVDTSTGVESSPGVKDPGRIAAFISAARAAHAALNPTGARP